MIAATDVLDGDPLDQRREMMERLKPHASPWPGLVAAMLPRSTSQLHGSCRGAQ